MSHIFVHGTDHVEKIEQGQELFLRCAMYGDMTTVRVEDDIVPPNSSAFDSCSSNSSSSSSSSSSTSALSDSSSNTDTRFKNNPLVVYSDTCCDGKKWLKDSGFHKDDVIFLLDTHHLLDRFYRAMNRLNKTLYGMACDELSRCFKSASPGRLRKPADIYTDIEKVKSKYSALDPPI